jgi:membrane-associated phospholipid phosphatase
VISDAYDDTFLRIVSYALATLVGVTRVIEGDHWFSDCFVGAAVGFAGAKLVECLNSYAPLSFTLLPLKGGFGTGLGVRF